jgi:hypothetical protein
LAHAPPTSHQATYRNLPLLLGGLLGSFALLIGGIAGAFLLAAAHDHQFPLMVGTVGVFVLFSAVCTLLALRRHRWTIAADAVLIEERPLVPMEYRGVRYLARRCLWIAPGSIAPDRPAMKVEDKKRPWMSYFAPGFAFDG